MPDDHVRLPLIPGIPTAVRQVPEEIPRPEYVGKPAPTLRGGSWVQSDETIDKMRVASRLAARAMAEAAKSIEPGVTTDSLDAIVHSYLCDNGAYPSTLGYRGFPKSCCTSINEVICHGIPDSTVIEEGDIVNIDVTAFVDGVHGDTCATYPVGDIADHHWLLIERTAEALRRGIKAVAPGRKINVIGRVIESYVKRFNYGLIRDYTGHGIAHDFHSGLVIPHYDDPTAELVMEPGMTFTIEPMVTMGDIAWDQWDDGWTVTTRDKSWTAQFEHTLVVTADGAEVLTLP